MIGGARHPEAASKTKEEFIGIAKEEIKSVLAPGSEPEKIFFAFLPKAIPQYNRGYPEVAGKINKELETIRGLHLTANYFGGVSVNDCVLNARLAAEQSIL